MTIRLTGDYFDDTLAADPMAKGYHGSTHPTGPLLSTLLSLIDKEGASGKHFLTAYHVGVEIMAKLNSALGPRSFAAGFHPTAIMSAFGAVAAAASSVEDGAHATTAELNCCALVEPLVQATVA